MTTFSLVSSGGGSRVSDRRSSRRRLVAVFAITSLVVLALVVASVAVGTFNVPATEVVRALVGSGAEDTTFIVRQLRLPRVATGLLVGAAFGGSGAVFQSVTRNPLATPDVIGITAGASAAAVFAIVIAEQVSTYGLAGAAAAGALATASLIYVLAWRRRTSPYRLVLVGIGLTAALASATSFLLTRTNIYDVQRATLWLTGSLNARGWEHARLAAIALVLLPPVAVAGRHLRILELGDDLAAGLGLRTDRFRGTILIGAVLLAALATAAAGPIGFVALAAPQIARRLAATGAPATTLSALVGALIVVAADLAARTVLSPTELPVGVVTAVVGAPYLLWLLARANRRETA